ncbi:CHAD domain-containing protein [Ferrimonas pelagia]|uniref:CHAD domain-containing protein n=1 Tax=Ferrimonas pelagia TaxID=1177826 RepID=A0ABP9EJM1_9GAMM
MTEGLVSGIRFRVLDLYEQALMQLPALREEGDREALHRYRVNLRKCRCLLELFIEELWQTPACALSLSFAAQIKVSNLVRDLDVFVAQLKPGPLRDYVEQLRQFRLANLHDQLHRLEREQLLCQSVLALKWTLNQTQLADATVDISEQLRLQIIAQTERALSTGKSKHWHRVRILVKKQRYLIDLCLPQGRSGLAQEWQDRLGAFNDSCCQLTILNDIEPGSAELKTELLSQKSDLQLQKAQTLDVLVKLGRRELKKKNAFGHLVEINR